MLLTRSAMVVACSGLIGWMCYAGEVVVDAKGQGVTEAEARADAVRRALETYAGTAIASKTEVQDFELIRDTIVARTSGLVSWVEEPRFARAIGGIIVCTGKVRVKTEVIDATWAEVKEFLDLNGRPTIMFLWHEEIEDITRRDEFRVEVQKSSLAQAKVRERLTKLGFTVLDANNVQAANKRRLEEAVARDDVASMLSISQEAGADMMVRGFARVSGPTVSGSDIRVYVWQSRLTLDCFWTDTSENIATKSLTDAKGASRVAGTAGGAEALAKAGDQVIDPFITDLLTQWSVQAAAGSELVLEVNGVPGPAQAVRLRNTLQKIAGVESVNYRFNRGGASSFNVKAKMNTEQFLEKLVEIEDQLPLEIRDQKGRKLMADYRVP